jgi:hypothetical protein
MGTHGIAFAIPGPSTPRPATRYGLAAADGGVWAFL